MKSLNKRIKRNNMIGFSDIKDKKRYKNEIREYREFLFNITKYVEPLGDSEYYDFYLTLLKKELRYSSLLEINRGNAANRFIYPFHKMVPELIGYRRPKEKIEIDIRDNNLLSQPWNHRRYSNLLHYLKTRDFKYDSLNHYAIYYDGLDVTSVYNGFHSLGVGMYLGEGKIEAEYYDVRKIFKYVNANEDLSFSYDKEKIIERLEKEGTKIPYTSVANLDDRFYGTDYRLMLIYELSKRKYENKG